MLHTKAKLLSVVVSTALLLTACNQDVSSSQGEDFNRGSGGENTNTDFNQLTLITSLTDNVISPTFEAFKVEAKKQQELVASYCSSEYSFAESTIEQSALEQTKNNAKEQWRATMNIWQQAELMQLGPLLEDDNLLRNNIYSWPTVSTCGVDFDVMFFKDGTVNGQPYDIRFRTVSRKGLDALEYLLFNENLEHSCETSAAPTGWNNLTNTERKTTRCDFAVEVAKDIVNNADILLTQWNTAQGYATQLKQAGTSNSLFTTEHDAVNAISDALFYIDSFTKDEKLAIPLGLLANKCGSSACPEDVESPYSNHSLTNIKNNLLAFQKFFTGSETSIGFNDYLVDVGSTITATEIQKNITKALASIEKINSSLADTLENEPDQVEQIHTDVKGITDQLKADFITSLALELPATSAGDND
ncbi:imelysin family protein [Colwellia sp. RE-S-Sl-9]